MAIGVPKKQKRDASKKVGAAVALCYPGKRTPEEILEALPGDFELVRKVGSESPRNRLYFGENLGVLSNLNRDPTVR